MAIVEANSIIKKITDTLVEKYHPVKIILFGSYAYGIADEDSDLDLLIIKDTDKKRRIDRFVEVKRLIFDPENKIPVSPIVLTNDEVKERLNMGDDFLEEILTKGKVLYER
jgi:predicted nucleotidyltransferase